MRECRKISQWNIIVTATMVLLSIAYFIIYAAVDSNDVTRNTVTLFSVIGVLEFGFILYSHKILSGKYFDLYSIFILLMFMFNFGQCLCWAFGIHIDGEIGDSLMWNNARASAWDIYRAQVVFLQCVTLFHLAASYKTSPSTPLKLHREESELYSQQKTSMFLAGCVLSALVVPLSLYSSVMDFLQAGTYGYGSLYYGDMAQKNPILTYADFMFIPCLVTLLISGDYKRKIRYIVYAVFAVYSVFEIASGNRGSWFYAVLLFLWMHHTYHKKISRKTFALMIVAAFLSLYILLAINTVRNSGISGDSIKNALTSTETNPFFSFLFEMGNSMGVNIMIIDEKPVFPLGNSYIASFFGSVTSAIPELFGVDYVTVSRWFSQDYLGITWGAAFTIVAEAVLNFGAYLGPFVFALIGVIFKKPLNVAVNKSPLKTFVYIVLSFALMAAVRNCAHDFFKQVFFSVVPIAVLTIVVELRRGK